MKAIDRIKHELQRYEADCLLALDDQECKACTATVFDSLRSIIARAEKEEQQIAADKEKTREYIRGQIVDFAAKVAAHMTIEAEAYIDGWRNQCLYYRPGEDPKEMPLSEVYAVLNYAWNSTLDYYNDEQKAAQEEKIGRIVSVPFGKEEPRKDYETPILYRCDPEKNTDCPKTACQRWCVLTTVQEFSTDGRALTREEIDEIQKKAEEEEDRRGTHE